MKHEAQRATKTARNVMIYKSLLLRIFFFFLSFRLYQSIIEIKLDFFLLLSNATPKITASIRRKLVVNIKDSECLFFLIKRDLKRD